MEKLGLELELELLRIERDSPLKSLDSKIPEIMIDKMYQCQ